MATQFTFNSFLLRFAFALALVFLTYNPSGYSWVGWLMSDILIDLINRRSFGWTMQRYFFAWTPVQAVLLALVAALLAGVYPVWRMSGMALRESLGER